MVFNIGAFSKGIDWGSAISALANIGSTIGGLFGAKNAEKAAQIQFQNQMALQENAQKWMENMSSTAHQREMADLQAAGLNPILTATGGSGAITPASGTGTAAMADSGSIKAQVAMESFRNGLAARQTKSNIQLQKAQAQQAQATALAQSTQSDLNSSMIALNTVEKAMKDIDLKYHEQKQLLSIKKIILDNIGQNVSNSLMRQNIISESLKQDYQRGRNALLGKIKSMSTNEGHNWGLRLWGMNGGINKGESIQYYD